MTWPLGFWRGVKLSPQRTRMEERRVRKTKQGKRPWVERRNGLTKLHFVDFFMLCWITVNQVVANPLSTAIASFII